MLGEWRQVDYYSLGSRNKPTDPRHLVHTGKPLCDRWSRFKARGETHPDAPKCKGCLRVLASKARHGKYTDPET